MYELGGVVIVFAIGFVIMFVLALVGVILKAIIEGIFHFSLKTDLGEYMTEFKCQHRKKYGPEYSLEYKIDKIETEVDAATVYCVFSEKFSKNDIAKERNEIIYLAHKREGGKYKWMVIDDIDNHESKPNN